MGGAGRDRTDFRQITYSPLPSQKLFHKSTARMKGFSGPIGSGKSQALCHEAIRLTYLNPGRSGLIGAPTYPMLRDTTQQTLFEILNSNRIPYDYAKAENILVMRESRSRILFRPLDEFERLRGTNLAWFGLDELTYAPEAAWLRLEGRLRDPKAKRLTGFAVWTPKGYDWVYRRFISEPKSGYEVIQAKPYENRFLLQQVPDFYDRLKSSYDEKFYQQEVLGQYLHMRGGLVYYTFDRTLHVANLEPDPSLPLLWALDFNVDPMSSVVAQIQKGRIRVLHEIVLRHATTEEACAEFYGAFGRHRAGIVVYGDASGNNAQTTGSSDYQIIRDFFRVAGRVPLEFRVPKANPQVRDRVNLMNAKLRSASGEIQMLVHGRCKELIKDFEQVAYKEDSNQVDKEKDRNRTHLSDALGYLVWQECRLTQPIGERPERLF
jgi:Terminase large subunit, T4likevirus-type, N-terminal